MKYKFLSIVRKRRGFSLKMILFSFLSMCGIIGCTGDEIAESDKNKKLIPLTVSTASLSKVITKAGTAITSGSIGVFRIPINGYTAQNNIQYDFVTDRWVKNSEDIYVGSFDAAVCAYYPFNPMVTNPETVPLTSQKYDGNLVISYSPSVAVPSAGPASASFTLTYAYAQITFSITRDTTYDGTCAITQIQIANPGIKTAATLNITNGNYAAGTVGPVGYNPEIATLASGATQTTSVLMVPVITPMTGNIDFTFVVDGKTMVASLSVEGNNLTTLDAGTHYMASVTIKGATLEADGVTTTDWEDQVVPGDVVIEQ